MGESRVPGTIPRSRTPRRALLVNLSLGALLAACGGTAVVAEEPSPNETEPSGTASVRASASLTPAPTATPEPTAVETVVFTYEGTWTLTSRVTENPYDEPEHVVGDTLPGTLAIECGAVTDYCNVSATRDGETVSVHSGEIVDDGTLRMVIEESLSNCGGQVSRFTSDITYTESEAAAAESWVYEPRTCQDSGSTLYMTDETWTFEGEAS